MRHTLPVTASHSDSTHSRSHGRRPARRLIGVLPPPRDLRSRDYRMVRWRHHERDDYPTVPMTLGNMRQLGIRSLAVIFSTCHHQAVVSADRWPDHVPAPPFRSPHGVRLTGTTQW